MMNSAIKKLVLCVAGAWIFTASNLVVAQSNSSTIRVYGSTDTSACVAESAVDCLNQYTYIASGENFGRVGFMLFRNDTTSEIFEIYYEGSREEPGAVELRRKIMGNDAANIQANGGLASGTIMGRGWNPNRLIETMQYAPTATGCTYQPRGNRLNCSGFTIEGPQPAAECTNQSSTGEAICAAFQTVQGRNGSQTVRRTYRNANEEYFGCQSMCTGAGLFHYGGTVEYDFPPAGVYSYCFDVPEERITLDTFSSGDVVCAVNRITIGRENPNNLSPGFRAGGDSMNPNGICPEPAEFTSLANYCPEGTTLNRIERLTWCVKN